MHNLQRNGMSGSREDRVTLAYVLVCWLPVTQDRRAGSATSAMHWRVCASAVRAFLLFFALCCPFWVTPSALLFSKVTRVYFCLSQKGRDQSVGKTWFTLQAVHTLTLQNWQTRERDRVTQNKPAKLTDSELKLGKRRRKEDVFKNIHGDEKHLQILWLRRKIRSACLPSHCNF